MNEAMKQSGVWFIYDGECPLCQSAAMALKIKEEYGALHLLDAREALNHELMNDINSRGFDLDEGMVIFDGEHFYHGKDALVFMARFGDRRGWFNCINKILFWSDSIAKLAYPSMRGVRNFLLRQRNISKIDNLNLKATPIFKNVFGDSWSDLPLVMQRHYQNRPYSDDVNTVEGVLDVKCAGPIKWFAPLFWLMGGVPPHNEKNVPVTVCFESTQNTKEFCFNRTFYFKKCKTYHFRSRMLQVSGNELIEIMRFGVGWVMTYHWEDERIKLKHKGYVIRVLGYCMPLPLTFILGAGNAQEKAVDDRTFDMSVDITHPWWGTIYEYKGRFTLQEG